MRHLTTLIAALCLTASSTTASVTRRELQLRTGDPAHARDPQTPSADSVVQFLLLAAATDFHAHGPPDPARFHQVRIGHVMTPGGIKQYLLCGQFLPAQTGSKAKWTSFVTIKTSGYEQYIGAQATAFCQSSSIIWEKRSDLSTSLQSQIESLR